MPLPLFDEPVAPAPPRPAPPPFELDDHRPKSHRPPTIARQGSAEHFAWWTAFNRGADGQSPPGAEHDEQIAAYAASGYRVGRLFRPLDVMKETRR